MLEAAVVLITLLTQTPPRDQRPVATGTGVIKGHVVDATTGTPLRRATVRTFVPDRGGNQPSTNTDDEGRYELRDLPPGKYTVSANKVGYSSASFGQTRPRGLGIPIELVDKQVVDKAVIKLTRGGVIVGRVMDDVGEPAVGMSIQAMQYRYGSGGRTLSATGMGGLIRTDDLGAFRLYGLEPGQYYVAARPNDMMSGPQPIGGTVGPTTTYFPTSPDPSTAQRVTVAAGRETGPIVITLVSTKLSRVRGRAIMSDGRPFAGSFVNVTVTDGNGTSGRSGSMVLPDGSFELTGLAPGTYHLSVRPQNARPDDDVEVARATVSLAGEEVDGLLLVGARAAIARGHVMTDDGSPLPYSSMNLMVNPPTPEQRVTFFPSGRVKDDQTFEMKGLFGPLLFRLGGFTMTPATGVPWMLKAVILNGTNMIDRPIDFQPGMVVEGLELVFTQQAAELSGTVTADRGAPPEETWIVLFPTDDALWKDSSRYVRAARPDKDGLYRFRMLPAHDDYLLVSAIGLEPGQFMDPDFLRSVRDHAVRLSIGDGEKKVQNIRIATAQ
jgi:hypothetical protein